MVDIKRNPANNKPISMFALVMIGVIAVDSIRTLPISAAFGTTLIFYYLLAGLLFLLPAALVSAELASAWPCDGGIYIWVGTAFGKPWGLLVAWLQWIYNIIWYPTIMALLASTLLYLFHINASEKQMIIIFSMLALFWLSTALTCLGMRASTILSTIGTLLGTIIPIISLVALTTTWLMSGNPSQLQWHWHNLLPQAHSSHLSLLTTLLFGLIGMEVTGVFAGDVRNPQRDYPRALIIAALLILISLICGSLAIATVLPIKHLNLASGVIATFYSLLQHLHLGFLMPLAALAIFIGGLGNLAPWLIGPSKCLMLAANAGIAPKVLGRCNRHGAPHVILLIQAVLFSILAFTFILFPKFNSAYILLSIMSAQLALLVYVLMFAAYIHLRFSHKETTRPFSLPFGSTGAIIISGAALLVCIAAFILGFTPPPEFPIKNIWRYETLLITSMLLSCTIPFAIYWHRTKKNNK